VEPEQIPVVECRSLIDQIADGIADIEKLAGGYVRFIFYRLRRSSGGGFYKEILPNALVMHAAVIPICQRQTNVAITEDSENRGIPN